MNFSYTKNKESEFSFIKKPNLTKKKFWRLGGEGVGVWLGLVFFFFFFQTNQSLKKKLFSF